MQTSFHSTDLRAIMSKFLWRVRLFLRWGVFLHHVHTKKLEEKSFFKWEQGDQINKCFIYGFYRKWTQTFWLNSQVMPGCDIFFIGLTIKVFLVNKVTSGFTSILYWYQNKICSWFKLMLQSLPFNMMEAI